jgi:hypothetical protein
MHWQSFSRTFVKKYPQYNHGEAEEEEKRINLDDFSMYTDGPRGKSKRIFFSFFFPFCEDVELWKWSTRVCLSFSI